MVNALRSKAGWILSLIVMVVAYPAFAWDVSVFWTGHSSVNPASPAQGQLDGLSVTSSDGNRWHYAEDSYTWWTLEARNWILANEASGRSQVCELPAKISLPASLGSLPLECC